MFLLLMCRCCSKFNCLSAGAVATAFNPISYGGGQKCPPKRKNVKKEKLAQAEGLRFSDF